MTVLGTASNISHKGLLIVRSELTPREKAPVFDSSGNELGRVRRVFGPVKAPYVVVNPSKGRERDLLRILGKKVYVHDH